MVTIRPERKADADSVRAVNLAAFPSALESRLVDALREAGKTRISLVAERDGRIIGHILFSPVSVEAGAVPGLGLAPVSVLPEYQGKGIGSDLIRAGLARAKEAAYGFVVVLGEPEYYCRFGFVKASRFGLGNEYGVDEPFMVIELRANGLAGVSGLVRYEPEFGECES